MEKPTRACTSLFAVAAAAVIRLMIAGATSPTCAAVHPSSWSSSSTASPYPMRSLPCSRFPACNSRSGSHQQSPIAAPATIIVSIARSRLDWSRSTASACACSSGAMKIGNGTRHHVSPLPSTSSAK
uniref:Uncharacterized protein n=1 Tax=uncultured marine virus TaxID=186617 RepID=A0A0F7L813_9VIRU|nr:hypothetical protein [uncultured marine virus]